MPTDFAKWNGSDADSFGGPISSCVYCTRLIGGDPSLVLHGGGNSSIKISTPDVTGREVDTLFVKGSGWDMASIETAGFSPLRMSRLHELLGLEELADLDMARELNAAKLDPAAPSPSVESLLHARIPYRCVQHSHADAIVTLTNTPDGDQIVRGVFGDDVIIVPYIKPGFDLARLVVELWPEQHHGGTRGMVLMNHGLFTFGDDDKTAYERHIELIDRAVAHLDAAAEVRPRPLPASKPAEVETVDRPRPDPASLAALRADISAAAGRPMILRNGWSESVAAFLRRPDFADLASRGPLTPDHVLRTKRLPMIGTRVDDYVTAYREYVDHHRVRVEGELEAVDPAPRIVLDETTGLRAAGRTWGEATAALDIYHHTIPAIERAADHLGGYKALGAEHIFDVEYWELEQAKLRRQPAPSSLTGQVAVVTGAASGIGRACAESLAAEGAVVVGIDISPTIDDFDVGPGSLGIRADLTARAGRDGLAAQVADHAGGADILVLSAGIFGQSRELSQFDLEQWNTIYDINITSSAAILSAFYPLLKQAPSGGSVVAVGSKNVPAPGAGAGAYSTSKAALTQLVRVAALEWATDGIRVNGVHPDGVFDTGLWDEQTLAQRAEQYGLTVEEYCSRNLLGIEVSSANVALSITALCTESFRATTGTFIPIDGGNDRVI